MAVQIQFMGRTRPAGPWVDSSGAGWNDRATEEVMTKVIVTGGSGKLGRAVLKDLVANGYDVLNIDQVLPKEQIAPTVRIDLTDFGEVAGAIMGAVDERKGPFNAVVHLAAIPAPGLFANA